MEPVIQTLLAVVVAAVTAYFTAQFRVRAEFRKELDTRLLQRKWDTYTEFAGIVITLLQNIRDRDSGRQVQVVDRLFQFTARLWLVGSDSVVDAIVAWQRHGRSAPESQSSPEILFLLGDVLVAMRGDLGYDASGVRSEDILSTIITDLDKHLPRKQL